MFILAISKKGAEFAYNARTAHKVSKASAEKIKTVLNKLRYKLTRDDQVWFVHEVDQYDQAYDFAEYQRFTIYKGMIKEKFS